MRHRSREIKIMQSGGYSISGNSPKQYITNFPASLKQHHTISDYWGKKVMSDGRLPPSNCRISHKSYTGGIVSGSRKSSGVNTVQRVANIATLALPSTEIGAELRARDKGDKEYRNMLLAYSNPGRSYFSVFVFVRELLEVLTLFKIPATTIGQLAGGSYLNVKFGWESFIRDIISVNKIVNKVESRVREINSIVKNGGISRRIKLDQFSATSGKSNYPIFSGSGYSGKGDLSYESRVEVHGRIRWQAHPIYLEELSSLEPFEVWNKAIAYVLSLERVTPADVWNIIPFSWLVDYFYDVNTFLSATQYDNVFYPVEACIIRNTKHSVGASQTNSATSWCHMSGFNKVQTIYERTIIDPTGIAPTLSLIPTGSQLTTIGALLLKLQKRF